MDLQPFLMIIHTVSIDIPDRIMTLKLNLIIIIHFFIIFADSSIATEKSSQEWVDQSLHSIKRHINLNGIDMSIVSHIWSYHQWACDKWNDIRTAMIESEDNTFSTWQKNFSSAFKTVSLLSKFTHLFLHFASLLLIQPHSIQFVVIIDLWVQLKIDIRKTKQRKIEPSPCAVRKWLNVS